jgi:hypothetical protein
MTDRAYDTDSDFRGRVVQVPLRGRQYYTHRFTANIH